MMYRYRIFAPLRKRPLEAAAGMVAVLRGAWAVLWPEHVHNASVEEFVNSLLPIRLMGLFVFVAGCWQFAMAYVYVNRERWRSVPIYIQVVTIGIVLGGYFLHDHRDVATAFYLAMWGTQVWIWGDLHYARRISA